MPSHQERLDSRDCRPRDCGGVLRAAIGALSDLAVIYNQEDPPQDMSLSYIVERITAPWTSLERPGAGRHGRGTWAGSEWDPCHA